MREWERKSKGERQRSGGGRGRGGEGRRGRERGGEGERVRKRGREREREGEREGEGLIFPLHPFTMLPCFYVLLHHHRLYCWIDSLFRKMNKLSCDNFKPH